MRPSPEEVGRLCDIVEGELRRAGVRGVRIVGGTASSYRSATLNFNRNLTQDEIDAAAQVFTTGRAGQLDPGSVTLEGRRGAFLKRSRGPFDDYGARDPQPEPTDNDDDLRAWRDAWQAAHEQGHGTTSRSTSRTRQSTTTEGPPPEYATNDVPQGRNPYGKREHEEHRVGLAVRLVNRVLGVES